MGGNEVHVVQQESTAFARLSGVLEGFPDRGRPLKPASRSGVAQNPAQGVRRTGGRAGDQRTLYALFINLFSVVV